MSQPLNQVPRKPRPQKQRIVPVFHPVHWARTQEHIQQHLVAEQQKKAVATAE